MAQEVQNGGADNGAAALKHVAFTAVKPKLFIEAPKASDAVHFYKAAFGAEEVNRTAYPKRKADQESPLVLSAELKLGSTLILVSDLIADDSAVPAKTVGTGCVFCLETEEVEAAVKKALEAGAVSEGEVTEGGCGERMGKLKDPYGNIWVICSPASECADVEA